MEKTRLGVGALMLFLSAQATASFTPGAAANEARAATPLAESRIPAYQRLVLSDPSWDAFVFVSAAAAIAMEISAQAEESSAPDASWAYQAAQPQFDYLAAMTDVGLLAPQQETPKHDEHWLS